MACDLLFAHPLLSMRGERGDPPVGCPEEKTHFLTGALTKRMPMERSGMVPPLNILVQTTLDRILDAQSTHCADAHGGEVTVNVDCRTCVALFDAVSAARIAAVETTTLPKRGSTDTNQAH